MFEPVNKYMKGSTFVIVGWQMKKRRNINIALELAWLRCN